MSLDWNGVGWDVSHLAADSEGREVPLQQNYLAHEFGHYLGLDHSCHTPSNATVGWCPPPEGIAADYCERTTATRMNLMMAMGNQIESANGNPWALRLRFHHHYKCGEMYLPELVPSA